MHTPQILETNHILKMLKHLGKAQLGGNVITCCKTVAGINANPHTALVLHLVNNLCNLLKSITQIASLPCSILNNGSNPLSLVKGEIN